MDAKKILNSLFIAAIMALTTTVIVQGREQGILKTKIEHGKETDIRLEKKIDKVLLHQERVIFLLTDRRE